jgi:hypothetical protein
MKKNLRNYIKPVVEVAALVIVVADLLLGAGLVWFSSRVDEEREVHDAVQRQVTAEEAVVKGLERTAAALPGTQGQIRLFRQNHVASRREGYGRATRLMWSLKEKAGVQLDGVGFKPERLQNEPFQRLALEVSVEGPFPKLINFAHSLETASDFVLVRTFNFTPGEGGKLSLHLSADFYITP